MTIFEHVLEGCAPVPLAGYLKALGVFRLIAEQKDPDARGFWRDERFLLRTRLSKEELTHFFLDEFSPTPVVSPWNAGSGFYFREGKTKERDLGTGRRIKSGVRDEATTATRMLDSLLGSTAARLEPYRRTIRTAKSSLDRQKLNAAPGDTAKAALIRDLRSDMPDESLNWIDAAATVTRLEVLFPPLLGSGGNDGNLDFSTTLIQALLSLIDADTGEPCAEAAALLGASLFAEVAQTGGSIAISQFAPSAIGAPNSSAGFDGSLSGNAWDIVLGLEGTLVTSTALVRRMDADEKGAAAFPFMIPRRGVFGAGAGNIAPADENARGEFWAPLWRRPASLSELLALFREGRVVVERETANNALDFAQALGRLGVDRGVSHFERYAFEQRYGNMYLGVPLDRRRVERNPRADLISDLTTGGWLSRARRALRERSAPASLLELGRRLDEALFRLAEDGSHDAVQEALIAIGELVLQVGRRPKLRESLPPPSLKADWATEADDESYEFALATSLASLDASTEDGGFRLPFRRHLGPLGWTKGREVWDDTTEAKALAVWTGRDLLRDMAGILERRLIEAQRHSFVHREGGELSPRAELPLRGWRTAPLSAVAAFLAGGTDDAKIGALAAGLAWAPTKGTSPSVERENPLPFAYAALKPLFMPFGVDADADSRLDPLPVARLLSAGRGDEALRRAQRVARGAGLTAAFAGENRVMVFEPARLTAALLFPIAPLASERLIARAYPDMRRAQEETDAA